MAAEWHAFRAYDATGEGPSRGGVEDPMRKVADCRRFPSESSCTLTISGTEGEVMEAAAAHAVSVHGHTDGPELRRALRDMLTEEAAQPAGA